MHPRIPENVCGNVATLMACKSGACPLLLLFQTFLGEESTLLLPSRFFIFFILSLIFLLLLSLRRSYFLIFLFCPKWPRHIHVFSWDNFIHKIVDSLVWTVYLRTDYIPVWLLWVISLLYTLLRSFFCLQLHIFLSFFCLLLDLICLPFLFIAFLGCLILLLLLLLSPCCL